MLGLLTAPRTPSDFTSAYICDLSPTRPRLPGLRVRVGASERREAHRRPPAGRTRWGTPQTRHVTADAVIAPSEVSFLLIFSFKGAADSETSYGRLLSHSSPSNRQVLQGYVPRSQAGWPSFASVILLAQLLIVSFPRATTRTSGSLIHKWHVNDEQEDLASGPFPKSWRLTVHTSHTPPVVAKGFLISSQR